MAKFLDPPPQAVFFPVNLWTLFTGNECCHRKYHKIFHSYQQIWLVLFILYMKSPLNLAISANWNIWYIFSFLWGQTSTKFHKKSGWPYRGSQEGKKKKTPWLMRLNFLQVHFLLNSSKCPSLNVLHWVEKGQKSNQTSIKFKHSCVRFLRLKHLLTSKNVEVTNLFKILVVKCTALSGKGKK